MAISVAWLEDEVEFGTMRLVAARAGMLVISRHMPHEDVAGGTDRVRNDKALHQPAVRFTAQPGDDFIVSGIPRSQVTNNDWLDNDPVKEATFR